MTAIRNLLALLGVLSILAVAGTLYAFRGFDPQAPGLYWQMAKTLAATGDIAEATVWKRKVEDGLSYEDVDAAIQSVAMTENIRDVGNLPLGDQVGLMLGEDWRKLKIYLYCNPLTAAKMVEYSEAYSAWLPCRITLAEDANGDLWLYALNMDMMIHGGRQLPPDVLEEAERVRNVVLTILDEGAQGAF